MPRREIFLDLPDTPNRVTDTTVYQELLLIYRALKLLNNQSQVESEDFTNLFVRIDRRIKKLEQELAKCCDQEGGGGISDEDAITLAGLRNWYADHAYVIFPSEETTYFSSLWDSYDPSGGDVMELPIYSWNKCEFGAPEMFKTSVSRGLDRYAIGFRLEAPTPEVDVVSNFERVMIARPDGSGYIYRFLMLATVLNDVITINFLHPQTFASVNQLQYPAKASPSQEIKIIILIDSLTGQFWAQVSDIDEEYVVWFDDKNRMETLNSFSTEYFNCNDRFQVQLMAEAGIYREIEVINPILVGYTESQMHSAGFRTYSISELSSTFFVSYT
jgi:hypothetical protein